MADAITKEFGVSPQLVGGHGGVLDIAADGKILFSKHKEGYKPTPEEIVSLLKSKT